MNSREEEASLLREVLERSLPIALGLPCGLLVLRWIYGFNYQIPVAVWVIGLILSGAYFIVSRPPARLQLSRLSFYAIIGFLIPIAILTIVVMISKVTNDRTDEVTWQEALFGFGAFALLVALTRGQGRTNKSAEQGVGG